MATSLDKKIFVSKRDLSKVLLRPRVTEKAAIHAEANSYAFEITDWATKLQVKKAIKEIYKFDPIKVRIVKLPAKKTLARGKVGRKPGVKKAYVYLKKGEKIEFI